MMTDLLPEIDLTATDRQAQARELYRAAYALGYTMTGAELGAKCERSERWGRDRIAEARAEIRESSPVTLPSLPPVAVTPPAMEPAPMPLAAAVPERQGGPAVAATAPKPVRVWPVWLLMLPAAVAIWGGWVGLGELAGFGTVNLLPGIAEFEVNTAITLPIGMEVYAAYALYVWLSGKAVGKALRFARASAVAALVVGALGQIAFHVMAAAGLGAAPWWITAAVACLPVGVLGMGAALAHMVRAEAE